MKFPSLYLVVEFPVHSDGNLLISSWWEDASGRIPRDNKGFNGMAIYTMRNILEITFFEQRRRAAYHFIKKKSSTDT